jgi:hypothetical protein
MTAKAFVKALRGPEDTPDTINPLSYLLTAIHTLDDLDRALAERAEDPSVFEDMIAELRSLHGSLTAALAEHDEIVAATIQIGSSQVRMADFTPEADEFRKALGGYKPDNTAL